MEISAEQLSVMFARHAEDILAQVSAMFDDRPPPIAREAIIVGDSYDPTDGTVSVTVGDTAGIVPNADGSLPDTAVTELRLPLLTTQNGDQTGPVGGERALVIPRTSGGWAVLLYHHSDDSPGAPAGERWIVRKDQIGPDGYPYNGTVNAYTKWTKDGATPGDGKAGKRELVGAYGSKETAGGHTDVMDDTGKAFTRTSAGGHKWIMDDAGRLVSVVTTQGLIHRLDDATGQIVTIAGQAQTVHDSIAQTISHVVPTGGGVAAGALWADLEAVNAGIHKGHITDFSGSIMTDMMQSFSKVYSAAMMVAGIPNAGAFNLVVAAEGWVLSKVTPPNIPIGSSLFRFPS